MAAESTLELESSVKKQRDEDEKNNDVSVNTVYMDVEGGDDKDPSGNGVSSVIPGWFSEISPMWPVGNKNIWPEFEIIEDQSECNVDTTEDNTLSNSLISRNRSDDTMNSLMDSFQGDDDKKSWAHFQERIANAPEQVLRYYRNSNAKPIWPILSGRPSKDDIPKCSYCGGSMCCEFQILPQLLYYFGVENETNSLDWASIVVYACEASCEASLPYKNEFPWVQLYSPSAAAQY